MFTGLVAGTGEVVRLTPQGKETRLSIRPNFRVPDWVKGESIAVNGACLSVETFETQLFTAYASEETLHLTNLQFLRPGSLVNLERALALGDRLGGHLVSGHVDGLALVASIAPAGSSLLFRLEFDPVFSSQVIPKGSVTLDGISLTVNACGSGFLEVNIIPETQKTTTIASWKPGTKVNFETDLIGKYVQKCMAPYASQNCDPKEAPNAGATSGLTLDFLRDNGF